MFYESLIILNISTLNFSEGVPASVLSSMLIQNSLGYIQSNYLRILIEFLKKLTHYAYYNSGLMQSYVLQIL